MARGRDVTEETDLGCVCDWDSDLWFVNSVHVDFTVCPTMSGRRLVSATFICKNVEFYLNKILF